MSAYSNILLNSVDLTALAGVTLEKIQYFKRAKRNVIRKKLARAHGSKLISADYAEKEILLEGVIAGTTKASFEANRDSFFRYLQPVEVVFRVPQSGGTRDYTGTVDDVDWQEDPMGGFGRFIVRFVCSSPFGLDSSLTTALNSTGNTTTPVTKTFAPAIDGSIACKSIITVTLSALTGGTNKAVRVTDTATGNYIQVSRTWTATDVLIADASAMTVKVNGTSVDFSGNLLELDPGTTQLTYSDTLTTRTWALKLEYKKRYQ